VVAAAEETTTGYPKGIPYIVGNEAAERFSYYGMRSILQAYLTTMFVASAALSTDQAGNLAQERVSLFMAGVYAFPMLGAILADRLLGKYHTILWLSLFYCVGHATLAFAGSTQAGVYTGLAFIALGAGGIKPNVSANVGDQFTKANKHLVANIYQIFYFSINVGSFGSTLLIPYLNKHVGHEIAFGLPGILMGIATLVFWLGRDRFIKIPPKPGGKLGALDALASALLFAPFGLFFWFDVAKWVDLVVAVACFGAFVAVFAWRQSLEQDSGFLATIYFCLRNRKPGRPFFDAAREKWGDEAADGPPAVFRVISVFATVSIFWGLFDQHATSWIRQATSMNLRVAGITFDPSQTPTMNPIFVLALIPFLNAVVWPALAKRGIVLSAIRKMSIGMFLAVFGFVSVALIQRSIDHAPPGTVSVAWQAIPYFLMTVAEVLVSAVGLEFAYTQAPRAMKSTIMGCWFIFITVGDLLVAYVTRYHMRLEKFFWVFAGIMLAGAIVFTVRSLFYKGKTYLQDGVVT
jgi:POT family proton-dependent oligopeptide transporter